MSKLIALRLDDDLAERIEARCSIRGQSRTRVIEDLLRAGFEDQPAVAANPMAGFSIEPKKLAGMPSFNPLAIPGVRLGVEAFGGSAAIGEAESDAVEAQGCAYVECDEETGESYRCRLAAHGPAVKHQRGEKIG